MKVPEENLRIENGVLYCPEDMYSVTPQDLREWCRRLLEGPDVAMPRIDLSRTRQVSSQHLGILAEAWAKSLEQGREIPIRISAELYRVFKLSGFDQVFKIEVDG